MAILSTPPTRTTADAVTPNVRTGPRRGRLLGPFALQRGHAHPQRLEFRALIRGQLAHAAGHASNGYGRLTFPAALRAARNGRRVRRC